MAISYLPLWFNLSQKGISKTELGKLIGISSATLAKLSKDEYVNLGVIDKICEKFDYPVEDVIKYVARKDNTITSLEINCFYEAEQPLDNRKIIMKVFLLKEVKQLDETPLYLVAPFVDGKKQSIITDFYIAPKQVSFLHSGGCICFSKMNMIKYESVKEKIGILPYNLISPVKNKYDELYSL